jgi:hypothetical protein
LGLNTTGCRNQAMGVYAGYRITTGACNTTIGYNAGSQITTGHCNIALGHEAGDELTTGNKNILIGSNANAGAVTNDHAIVMGHNVDGVGTRNFTFGDASTDSNIAFGATSITAPSDMRLKEDIQDEIIGLDFLNELRPVTFLWKKEKDISSELKSHKKDSEKRVMNGKYNHGFIAQEVKATIDKYGLKEGFDMWQEDDSDGRQRIAPSAAVPLIIKAIQELSEQNKKLKAEIELLKNK